MKERTEKRKTDEEKGVGGWNSGRMCASEESSGLCVFVCVFCPCLFIFCRPQRETGRKGESWCQKERNERASLSWWAIMAQFSVL